MTSQSPSTWPFLQRWRIRGCLVTETPLFIGSGDTNPRPELENEGEPIEIADCLRDHRGLPLLPGTSLKGILRSLLKPDHAQVIRLFGEDSEKNDSGRGGEAEFLDAPLQLPLRHQPPLPHWSEERQTWLEIINSIDREHGSAAKNHLVHRETLAPGCGFAFTLTGQFSHPEEDIPLLLALLEKFNDTDDPLCLGADTANGKGRLRWELQEVARLDQQGALNWLENHADAMPDAAFTPLRPQELASMRQNAILPLVEEASPLKLEITLGFQGPFLVNNPPRKTGQTPGQADARPRTDALGRVILPASSFKGVLRSRAERILRTLLDQDESWWLDNGYEHELVRRVACRPERSELACKPITRANQRHALCLACQLFGAPGWRSPLQIDDFVEQPGHCPRQRQEMLAVDRFTGGGRDGAKFNALAAISPRLQGRVRLKAVQEPWQLGLLALVLRDLEEGDLRFGWGAAAKGYGRCTADIDGWDEKSRREAIEGWKTLLQKIEALKDELLEPVR